MRICSHCKLYSGSLNAAARICTRQVIFRPAIQPAKGDLFLFFRTLPRLTLSASFGERVAVVVDRDEEGENVEVALDEW